MKNRTDQTVQALDCTTLIRARSEIPQLLRPPSHFQSQKHTQRHPGRTETLRPSYSAFSARSSNHQIYRQLMCRH